jgi:hypothetical protein
MWYLFGVVRRKTPVVNDTVCFDHPAVCPVPIKVIAHRDIAVVVAELPSWNLNESDRADALQKLVIHQRTLEHVMQAGSVLPIRFGTVVDSFEDVRVMLRKGYSLLDQALADMEGKIETQLTVSWDTSDELRAIAQSDAAIQAMKRQTDGTESMIGIGRALERKLEARRSEIAARVLERLEGTHDAYIAYERAHDNHILSAAFLMDEKAAVRFEARVRHCDVEFGDTLTFKLILPLPPHSFRTVVVRKLSAQQLDHAMRLFEVTGETTREKLKEKNRELMRRLHPDKSPNANTESFARVHSAFVLLKTLFEHDDKPFHHINREHCLHVSVTGAVVQFPEIHAR